MVSASTGRVEFSVDTQRQLFDAALEDLNMTSSVGKCQMDRYGATIGVALGYDPIAGCNQERVDFLYHLVNERLEEMRGGRLVSDPINLFVKQEPHKQSKIREGRYRLISAVSLVDTMIDRMIFGHIKQDAWQDSPVLIGWTPRQGGYRWLWERLDGGKRLEIDKRAWDWSMQPWVVRGCLEVLEQLSLHHTDEWLKLARSRFEALFYRARFDGAGLTFDQAEPGIMKSGCFLTIFANSLSQLLLHFVAVRRSRLGNLIEAPFCMGDDTIQRCWASEDQVDEYVRQLEEAGCVVGDCELLPAGSDFQFCGFRITKNKVVPAYTAKHCFVLQHLEDDTAVETLDSYQQDYVFEPHIYGHIADGLLEIRPNALRSKGKMRRFLRGDE